MVSADTHTERLDGGSQEEESQGAVLYLCPERTLCIWWERGVYDSCHIRPGGREDTSFDLQEVMRVESKCCTCADILEHSQSTPPTDCAAVEGHLLDQEQGQPNSNSSMSSACLKSLVDWITPTI